MNYDRTLLELLEKVKELEERIERLEQPSNIVPASPEMRNIWPGGLLFFLFCV